MNVSSLPELLTGISISAFAGMTALRTNRATCNARTRHVVDLLDSADEHVGTADRLARLESAASEDYRAMAAVLSARESADLEKVL